MDFFPARAGVTARLGVAARADERDAERDQPVAQPRRFARREHEAGVGEHQPERAHELHQFAVGHVRERLEFARARTQARQRDRDLRLPAMAQ